MRLKLLFFTLFVSIIFVQCKKKEVIEPEPIPEAVCYEPTLPDSLYSYNDTLPDHFNTSALNLFESFGPSNTITDEGATLGRVLFYDKNLSANNTISCASCHKQELAFADDVAFSEGYNGGLTGRNSMAIINARYSFRFFWDRRANGLEDQVLGPIQDPVEMGMDLATLETKLATLSYYEPLFDAAFGSTEITSERISLALAQFVRSIQSYRSKYDVGEETGFANYTQQELDGKDLFFSPEAKCGFCHMTANFYTPGSMNNGLDSIYTDGGVGDITGDPEDNGQFSVVSLRNIELTAPYMHDGRFATLMEVIEHYNSGVQPHPYLDDRLGDTGYVGGAPVPLNLTQAEKEALEAFMLTLTDHEMIQDVRFSDPFPQ